MQEEKDRRFCDVAAAGVGNHAVHLVHLSQIVVAFVFGQAPKRERAHLRPVDQVLQLLWNLRDSHPPSSLAEEDEPSLLLERR